MRSLLFAGATRPDLVAKLGRSGPDAVAIDLEDAVPPNSKLEARAALPELVASVEGTRTFVRVNGPATALFDDDLAAVAELPVAGVLIPETESAADLERAGAALGKEADLIAGIESARGVADAREILTAAAPAGAYFGAEDYAADVGGRRTREGDEILYARSQVVLAARLAGVSTLDQVVIDFRDGDVFMRDACAGRAIGYSGKLCIHPSQVPLANDVFGATSEQLERARAMLATWEAAAANGIAAVEFEGAMIDGPALRMARDTIARAIGD